jgi:hypothetical protein
MNTVSHLFGGLVRICADGEMKLYLAPKGEFSMFEGQIVHSNWLKCEETNLFEIPVALTEDD